MILEREIVSFFGTNCYLLGDEEKGEAVIIDPGGYPTDLAKELKDKDLKLVGILVTHSHPDHLSGLRELQKDFPEAKVYLHDGSEKRDVREGDKIPVGNLCLHVLEAPGHSKDSVMFFEPTEKILFPGDNLFKMSVGRTDLGGGSFEQLMESIKVKIIENPEIPEETRIFPGHMGPTSKGFEKANNPFRKFFL